MFSHAHRPVGRHRRTSSALPRWAAPRALVARAGALGATGVVAALLVNAAPAPALPADPTNEAVVEAALAVRLDGVSRGSRSADRLVVGGTGPSSVAATTVVTVDAGVVALTDALEPLGVPVPMAAAPPDPPPAPVAPAPAGPAGLDVTSFAAGGAALGLRAAASRVYSAVRSAFDIGSFSGYRGGDQDHGSGKAVDVMISSSAQGDAVAAFVLAHAKELNVKYVIWRQRIYNMDRPGWRGMANRGSATANHYDHVHISVN